MNCFEANHTDNLAPWTLLDGGMGRELLKQGAPFRQPQWSALALMEAPETVLAVHRAFIAVGAQVITTNSYALVPFHLGAPAFYAHGQQWADLAGRLARQAVQESRRNVRVAASLPPLFGSYQPALFDVVRAPEIAQRLIAGLAPYADIWLAETLSSIQEAEFIQSMLPESSQPFWVSFTLADDAGGGD